MELHSCSILKCVAPARDAPVLLGYQLAAHQGECVVGMPSIQASNKGSCEIMGQDSVENGATVVGSGSNLMRDILQRDVHSGILAQAKYGNILLALGSGRSN